MNLRFVLGCCAALVCLSAGPVAAQNADAQPTYGTVQFVSDESEDAYVNVEAGGPNSAGEFVEDCVGYVATEPDVRLYYDALPEQDYDLIISATSAEDVTLLVRGPDGLWYCNDDSWGLSDPELYFEWASSGRYDIFIGTFGAGSTPPATLVITEEWLDY